MNVVLDGNSETPRRLQELARHNFIRKMLAEILADMMVCELEGWDKMEFIERIHTETAAFLKKRRGDKQ